ncbi:MAG: recombinase family protein [Bryobacteraceae bacterium]
MVKAFAYLRVSGKGQVKGDGFPRQLAAIKAYAGANGVTILQVFREEGVCGARESLDRPAFTAMMAALYSNGTKMVLIERLDRLARDLMVQEATIADLHKHGFTLVSVVEPDLMATDPQRVFFRQVMGAVAQLDKSNVVAKLRGARMRKKAVTGRCEGRKPFGHREGEQAIIDRMKALRATGLGYDKIAEQLNIEGIKPRSGQRWWGRSVNNTLHLAIT